MIIMYLDTTITTTKILRKKINKWKYLLKNKERKIHPYSHVKICSQNN